MTLTTGNDQGSGVRGQGSEKKLYPVPCTLYPVRGVTLVEVLLAVVILSVGLVGVLRAYAASIGALEISREMVTTVGLLKEKMADVEQAMIEQGGVSAGSSSGQFEGEFEGYNWAWEATTGAQDGLCELDLTVFPPGESDGSWQISLVTYAQNRNYKQE